MAVQCPIICNKNKLYYTLSGGGTQEKNIEFVKKKDFEWHHQWRKNKKCTTFLLQYIKIHIQIIFPAA